MWIKWIIKLCFTLWYMISFLIFKKQNLLRNLYFIFSYKNIKIKIKIFLFLIIYKLYIYDIWYMTSWLQFNHLGLCNRSTSKIIALEWGASQPYQKKISGGRGWSIHSMSNKLPDPPNWNLKFLSKHFQNPFL